MNAEPNTVPERCLLHSGMIAAGQDGAALFTIAAAV